MIKSGIYATCDECGFEDKIPSLDHIPGGWYVLFTVADGPPGVPQVSYHLCSEECVTAFVHIE